MTVAHCGTAPAPRQSGPPRAAPAHASFLGARGGISGAEGTDRPAKTRTLQLSIAALVQESGHGTELSVTATLRVRAQMSNGCDSMHTVPAEDVITSSAGDLHQRSHDQPAISSRFPECGTAS